METTRNNSSPPSGKRLILFFDGTWMDVLDETNVYLFAKNVASQDAFGKRQKFFYSPGVGTTALSKIPGGVAGIGLHNHLLDGYEWLCQNYDDGDEIWIFGFSRGAYTARSLAGMIRKSGLLYVTNPAMLGAALALYRDKTLMPGPFLGDRPLASQEVLPNEAKAVAFRQRFSREATIDFLGVWDTVGALGIPGFGPLNRQLRWHDTQLSRIVRRAYHAMAIDEQRAVFSATPWVHGESRVCDPNLVVDRDVEQRWFIGSHGDVGGGCEDPTLSKIPLAWMQYQAARAGLGMRQPELRLPETAFLAPIFPSYDRFARSIYKTWREVPWIGGGRFHREVITDPKTSSVIQPCIDASVLSRWKQDPSYRPPGLGDLRNQQVRTWDPEAPPLQLEGDASSLPL